MPFQKGHKPWNKGLTKESDDRVRWMGEKHRGLKHTDEAKAKMREAKVRNPMKYWLGKKRPGLWKNRIHPFKGKKLAAPHKDHIGIGLKNFYEKHPEAKVKKKINGILLWLSGKQYRRKKGEWRPSVEIKKNISIKTQEAMCSLKVKEKCRKGAFKKHLKYCVGFKRKLLFSLKLLHTLIKLCVYAIIEQLGGSV